MSSGEGPHAVGICTSAKTAYRRYGEAWNLDEFTEAAA
jgi:hypothetical protein